PPPGRRAGRHLSRLRPLRRLRPGGDSFPAFYLVRESRKRSRAARRFGAHVEGTRRAVVESSGEARSVERAARNEAAFREANRELERRRRDLGVDGERLPFLCECEAERCTDVILARPGEFADGRASPIRFLV